MAAVRRGCGAFGERRSILCGELVDGCPCLFELVVKVLLAEFFVLGVDDGGGTEYCRVAGGKEVCRGDLAAAGSGCC